MKLATTKAIETRYSKHKFRSRLEARWAVFFDNLEIKWEYEKEGYNLQGELYLPDFYIPSLDCWIEIKGEAPGVRSERLAELLAKETGSPVYIFFGQIQQQLDDQNFAANDSAYFYEEKSPDGSFDIRHKWTECSNCGRLEILFDGRSDRMSCKESFQSAVWRKQEKVAVPLDGKCPRSGENFDKGYNSNSKRLLSAYGSAISARFEWGE
jgi:hypothetical protein